MAGRLDAAACVCAALTKEPGPLSAAVVSPLPLTAAAPPLHFVAELPPDFALTVFPLVAGPQVGRLCSQNHTARTGCVHDQLMFAAAVPRARRR
jgi:hypothetical protein